MPYKLVQSISSLASYTAYIANSGPHDIILLLLFTITVQTLTNEGWVEENYMYIRTISLTMN